MADLAKNDAGAPASDVQEPAKKQQDAPVESRKLDETRKGGRFLVDGRLVNADGKPLDEEK